MSGEHYQHTQPAGVILVSTIIGIVAAVAALVLSTASFFAWFVIALLLIVAVLFSSLTVEVDDEQVRWYFGPGFWKKSLKLADISTIQSVRNKWWYGWGIRYTPHGWLYNVSGLGAVEFELVNGRRLRVGTDEPDRLRDAVLAAKGSGEPKQ